jgi:hypothetical protein
VPTDDTLELLRAMRAEAQEFREETRSNFEKLFRRLDVMEAEMHEFREETRANFGKVFHRLNVMEAVLANLKADVAILLILMCVQVETNYPRPRG